MKSDAEPQDRRAEVRLLATLGTLLAFASISTDLFLPALPAMARDLGAVPGELELVVSTYLLGFGLGQLFWGPISDRFGRRGPLMVGLGIFALGSAACAMSTMPSQIIAWRIVQALGASAGVALARAMVRDIYDRDQAARVLSILMTVMAIAPLLGPSVGAQILAFAGWQSIFWTLVLIGGATILAVLALPESLKADQRSQGSVFHAFRSYADHLRNPVLLFYASALGFYFAGIFGSVAGAPFAFVTYHGLSPEAYALIFACGIFGLMGANLANTRLVGTMGSDRILLIGAIGAMLSGIAFAVVAATDLGGIWGLVLVNLMFTAMNGLILANGIAGALSKVKTGTGGASAVVGAVQYGGGMVGAAAVSLLADGTPGPMGFVCAVAGCGCLLCIVVALRLTSVRGHLS
jgi:MFS transporter, DHA1 family, multidrug resistance protein